MKAAKATDSPYEKKYSILQNIVYYLRFYRKNVPVLLWMILIEILLGAVAPYIGIYLPKSAVDLVTKAADGRELIWKLAGLGLAYVLVNMIWESVKEGKYCLYNTSRSELIADLFLKSLRLPYRDTERQEVRELYQKSFEAMAMGDGSSLYGMTYGALSIVQNIISFVLYSTVLGVLSPFMVVLLLALSLVQYVLNFSKIKCLERYRASDAKLGRRRRYLSNAVMGSVKAAKEIRIFGMREWLDHLLNNIFAEMKKQERIKRRSENVYVQINGALTVLRDAAAYAWLICRVARGTIGAGDFVLYFGAITGFSMFIESVIGSVGMLRRGSNGLNFYRAFLELPEEFSEEELLEEGPKTSLSEGKYGGWSSSGKNCREAGGGQGKRHIEELQQPIEITFEDVSFSYSDLNPGTKEAAGSGHVFRHFNLTIRGGEKVALVGVNGAGKTTFVKLLCGIYEPREGRILLNGIDRREFARVEVYGLFSAVFQEKFLPPFQVGESIAMEKKWNEDKVWDALEKAGLRELFQKRGIATDSYYGKIIDEAGVELSGGQEQRFLLARALYKDAPVLVLDEPTAALDPIAESEIYDTYLNFSKHRTAVFISHRLASTRFSDRIILLDGGRVVEEGTHEELIARGQEYAVMFQVQSSYYTKSVREKEAFS